MSERGRCMRRVVCVSDATQAVDTAQRCVVGLVAFELSVSCRSFHPRSLSVMCWVGVLSQTNVSFRFEAMCFVSLIPKCRGKGKNESNSTVHFDSNTNTDKSGEQTTDRSVRKPLKTLNQLNSKPSSNHPPGNRRAYSQRIKQRPGNF